jgi:hypothetical protein
MPQGIPFESTLHVRDYACAIVNAPITAAMARAGRASMRSYLMLFNIGKKVIGY